MARPKKKVEGVETSPSLEKKEDRCMTTASVSMASNNDKKVDLVKVKISYPKDWKFNKYFVDGEEKGMRQAQADQLIKKGIAKIIK